MEQNHKQMYKLICVLMPGVITGHAPNGIPKPGDCHTLLVLLKGMLRSKQSTNIFLERWAA